MGNYTTCLMFENPRRGRQARNFTENDPKILDLKSSFEQIIIRKLSLGAPDISLGRILHSLRGRRKNGRGRERGREKSAKEGEREGKQASLTLSPQSPSFFQVPPYPLPHSTPATHATYCMVNNTDSCFTMKCWSCQRITTESTIHNL